MWLIIVVVFYNLTGILADITFFNLRKILEGLLWTLLVVDKVFSVYEFTHLEYLKFYIYGYIKDTHVLKLS